MQDYHIYKFIVTEDLLDELGHVNNANYLRLYERARWNILEESSMGVDFVRRYNQGPIILEITIGFRKELKPGQEVIIETRSRRKGSRLFVFDQVMKDNEGRIFSKAEFTGALFNLKTRKMIVPDEKWIKAFQV